MAVSTLRIQKGRDMATGERQNQFKFASSGQPCAVALTSEQQTLIEYITKDMILHYPRVGCVLQVVGCLRQQSSVCVKHIDHLLSAFQF